MDIIHHELNKMGIVCQDVSVLQDKDGVIVARVASGEKSYVRIHLDTGYIIVDIIDDPKGGVVCERDFYKSRCGLHD